MSRPSDHVDAGRDAFEARDRRVPKTPATGPLARTTAFLRMIWRQLTSMRVALLLLLLLAIAAVPGSLVPQNSSDPNGVVQYFDEHPDLAEVLDRLQLFDVYSSAWFTAIYLLLFVSLVGCIIPRIGHHWRALRTPPPTTPARLERLDAYSTVRLGGDAAERSGEIVDAAKDLLAKRGYRTLLVDKGRRGLSVSAERGYLRETGNLVFHIAMLGIIIAFGVGSGFSWQGQRVIVEGQTFTNDLVSYSTFTPGRFFEPDQLTPYSLRLDSFDITYEEENRNAIGQATDFAANVTVRDLAGVEHAQTVRVNQPLRYGGTDVYLLGNGYAPEITVRDPDGRVVFSDNVPFLPQDQNLTSLGVVKVPDGLEQQVGMVGFFYPTAAQLDTGAFTSEHPDLGHPMLTLNVYEGDLGLNEGIPANVYALETETLTQVAGGETGVESLKLRPGESVELPGGAGTVSLGEIPRYASFDVHHDPTQMPALVCAVLIVAGLLVALLVPRRRLWVKAIPQRDGTLLVEYAGLARGEDPQITTAVNDLLDAHSERLVGFSERDRDPTPEPTNEGRS